MNILITNDDGIDAQGISVLAQAAADFGDVTVVAPAEQCSAMSHRITLSRRMRIEKRGMDIPHVTAYALDGTPADCVKAALDAILQGKPDVVLSGINHGYNVGFDVAYSGTVGAAMEAVMSGIPAIALSQNDVGSFDVARQYLHRILEELLPTAPSDREIWNVNFPTEHCNGILRDRTVSVGGYYNGTMYVAEEDGQMHVQYPPLLPTDFSTHPAPEGSDLRAVVNGYISIGRVRCPVM